MILLQAQRLYGEVSDSSLLWFYCSKKERLNVYNDENVSSGDRGIFRIMGFENGGEFIVLTNAFAKKTQKTPKREIELAEQRKKIHLEKNQNE